MTRSETSRPGSSRGFDPVARTTSAAPSVRPLTSTAGPFTNVASPWMTSILRAFTSPVSPLTSLSTVLRWNAITPSQSTSPLALMPHSSERCTESITAADCKSAFVGMHPRSRQVPPRRSSFSIIATRLPRVAARSAHE